VAGPRLYVDYVLDLAEIPTFQAGRIDAPGYARRIARGVQLTVDGRRARVVPVEWALAHPNGAGGLKTTRFEVILRGPRLAGRSAVGYRDGNYADRIGWREIVVGDAPSRSHELRTYPKNLLSAPLEITRVRTSLVPGTVPKTRPHVVHGAVLRAPDRVADSGFASLVARDRLGLWVVLGSLAVALFWGAAHALSPGHGKTIVTAYLVGQRGSPRHAALLGLIVTVTHTIGVFGIGLVTLLLSRFIVPDHLYPWLNLTSGVLVVAIGASVLRARWRHRAHHHHHDHGHEHELALSRRSLVAVGVSGGLLPCPSALVVLLAAIAQHQIALGLLMIVVFSLGLASTLTGLGVAVVSAGRLTTKLNIPSRLTTALPALSALVIVVAGAILTVNAVPQLA
jgi:nickel/cobalt transporter (NicO) family protein